MTGANSQPFKLAGLLGRRQPLWPLALLLFGSMLLLAVGVVAVGSDLSARGARQSVVQRGHERLSLLSDNIERALKSLAFACRYMTRDRMLTQYFSRADITAKAQVEQSWLALLQDYPALLSIYLVDDTQRLLLGSEREPFSGELQIASRCRECSFLRPSSSALRPYQLGEPRWSDTLQQWIQSATLTLFMPQGQTYYLLISFDFAEVVAQSWNQPQLGQLAWLSRDGVVIGTDGEVGLALNEPLTGITVQRNRHTGVELWSRDSLLFVQQAIKDPDSGTLHYTLLHRIDDLVLPLGDRMLTSLRSPYAGLFAVYALLVSWPLAQIIRVRSRRVREANLLRALLNSMAATVITDEQGIILSANKAFTEITGYPIDDALGKRLESLFSQRMMRSERARLWQQLQTQGHWRGELWSLHKQGHEFAQLVEINRVMDEHQRPLAHVVTSLDLTEQKLLESQLRELSLRDPLTGCWNRRKLNETLDIEISRHERSGHSFALAVVDLDHFKQINDQHGHDVGDHVLRRFVALVQAMLRRSDLLVRAGGEEFIVFMPDTSRKGAVQVMERLLSEVAQQPELPRITCSIGLALYHQGDHRSSLIKRADQALYLAKEGGRNRLVIADA